MPAGVKQTDAAGWLLIGVPRAAGVRNETEPDGLKEEAQNKKSVCKKKKKKKQLTEQWGKKSSEMYKDDVGTERK